MSKNDLVLAAGNGRMFIGLNKKDNNLDIVYLKEEFAVEVGTRFGDIREFDEEMVEIIIGLPQVDNVSKAHIMHQVSGLLDRKINHIIFPHGVIITFQDNQQSINTVVEAINEWAAVGLGVDITA